MFCLFNGIVTHCSSVNIVLFMYTHIKMKHIRSFLLKLIQKSRILGFAIFIWKRSSEFRLNQVAASLSFTTLLALVPFFTVTFIVISAFPVFSELTERFQVFLAEALMPEYASKVIGTYMKDFTAKAGNLTAIGIIVLVVSSVLLIMTIERTFNQIWRTRQQRPVVTRVLVYWGILTLGPLILGAGLSLWGWLFSTTTFPLDYPFFGLIIRVSGSIALTTLLLWSLYRFVPHRYVPNRHALIGAFVAALALEIARRVFAFYIGNFASYHLIYGAFAVLPVFLIWLFCLWYILLAGAVLTASFSYWWGDAFRYGYDTRGRFGDILKIMLALYEAQLRGRAVNVRKLRDKVQMGYDELGNLLDSLAKKDYIAMEKRGWILKTSVHQILLSDLFRMFVYEPKQNHETDPVNEGIYQLMQPNLVSLDISLDEFAVRCGFKLERSS